MLVGAAGLVMAWQGIAVGTLALPLMLLALFAMGVHSTFFGPIKYAILPQHLRPDEVLGGTGLVEAGTYVAILGGTLLAGIIPVEAAAVGVLLIALVGYFSGRQVPPAPALEEAIGSTSTSFARRSGWSGRRCTSDASSSRSSRSASSGRSARCCSSSSRRW